MEKDVEYGYFELVLKEYMEKHNITKYFLREKANLQPTQLQYYYKNRIQRIDLAVMARICYALDCDLSDILIYHKTK